MPRLFEDIHALPIVSNPVTITIGETLSPMKAYLVITDGTLYSFATPLEAETFALAAAQMNGDVETFTLEVSRFDDLQKSIESLT